MVHLKFFTGIKTVEISYESNTYSWDEIENSEAFAKVMEQSENEFKNRKTVELTDELIDEIFDSK